MINIEYRIGWLSQTMKNLINSFRIARTRQHLDELDEYLLKDIGWPIEFDAQFKPEKHRTPTMRPFQIIQQTEAFIRVV
ncbi:DUF1127 domain-containing protein [Phyllobacterium sp. YR531]|uniref:DUF1127 domain-containing protein n=1 Tax=Phyllobacterium sp. YR531 TaxID=1144343 RepID=UPI0005931511|nr:DUF1127 domain-containing protein [Phyllobacterium sp. YR531]